MLALTPAHPLGFRLRCGRASSRIQTSEEIMFHLIRRAAAVNGCSHFRASADAENPVGRQPGARGCDAGCHKKIVLAQVHRRGRSVCPDYAPEHCPRLATTEPARRSWAFRHRGSGFSLALRPFHDPIVPPTHKPRALVPQPAYLPWPPFGSLAPGPAFLPGEGSAVDEAGG